MFSFCIKYFLPNPPVFFVFVCVRFPCDNGRAQGRDVLSERRVFFCFSSLRESCFLLFFFIVGESPSLTSAFLKIRWHFFCSLVFSPFHVCFLVVHGGRLCHSLVRSAWEVEVHMMRCWGTEAITDVVAFLVFVRGLSCAAPCCVCVWIRLCLAYGWRCLLSLHSASMCVARE